MSPRVYLDQLLMNPDPFTPRVRVSDNMVNINITFNLKIHFCRLV